MVFGDFRFVRLKYGAFLKKQRGKNEKKRQTERSSSELFVVGSRRALASSSSHILRWPGMQGAQRSAHSPPYQLIYDYGSNVKLAYYPTKILPLVEPWINLYDVHFGQRDRARTTLSDFLEESNKVALAPFLRVFVEILVRSLGFHMKTI